MSSISNLNRMAGLMSGLDTEALVKAMTANTMARINSQKQKLQLLQWKQESYRSVISKISDFKSKYLDILSPTSIKAQAVMNKYKATSSNDKLITATAAAGAAPGTYTIKSATAAKAATVNSNGSVAAGKIDLDFSNNVNGKDYTVYVTLDGTTKSVSFKGSKDAETAKKNFLEAANAAFSGTTKNSDQAFKFDGNSLYFDSNGDGINHTFSVSYNSEAVGLKNNAYSQISTSSTLGSIGFNQALKTESGTYNITINGVNFEFYENTTVGDMMNTINNSNAGVKMSFSNISQSFTLETTQTGAGSEIKMYQSHGNLLNALFNIEPDKMNAIEPEKGAFTYQTTRNAYSDVSSDLASKLKNGFDAEDDTTYKMSINVDGKDYELELDLSSFKRKEDGETYSDDEISSMLDMIIKQKYSEAAGEELSSDVKFEYDSKGTAGIRIVHGNTQITIGENDLGLEEGTSTWQTVNADESYRISDAKEMRFIVDGKEVIVRSADEEGGIYLSDLIDAGVIKMQNDGTIIANGDISVGYIDAEDGIEEGAKADEEASAFLKHVFNGKDTGIKGARDSDMLTVYGSNSVIEVSNDGVNFVKYTSSSNLFTFDGTTIDVSKAGEFVAESEDDYITIETAKDVSGLMDVIKGFVNDYNTLLSDLYGEMGTSRPKSQGDYYNPLTEDQEEEMSDKEIEKWNEQAKIGLLYNDPNIQKFLSSIRSAMNVYVDGFGLRDMGISLTDDWRDNGKLEIDESKLESALNAYGDKVAELFTGENGLASKLEKVVDNAISTKTKSYGYLSSLAGIDGTKTDKDNQIYREIESIQKIIDRLNEKYEKEQERYWSKFTALETYMAKMQAQMSYFTDMGNSGSSY